MDCPSAHPTHCSKGLCVYQLNGGHSSGILLILGGKEEHLPFHNGQEQVTCQEGTRSKKWKSFFIRSHSSDVHVLYIVKFLRVAFFTNVGCKNFFGCFKIQGLASKQSHTFQVSSFRGNNFCGFTLTYENNEN